MKKVSQKVSLNKDNVEEIKELFRFFKFWYELNDPKNVFGVYLMSELKVEKPIVDYWLEISKDFETGKFEMKILYERYNI
jgi:hypothetical protein